MKNVYRNIAVVTVVFMLALMPMLLVSYYQMRRTTPLQLEVMETLKELNEQNDNEKLQAQIRELDLLSRKAYFVNESQLKSGVYILLGMGIVLITCLNLFYKESMNLPEKELDPIDEWMNNSRSRRYIYCGSIAAVVLAAGYLVVSSGMLHFPSPDGESQPDMLAEASGDSIHEEVVLQDTTKMEVADTTALAEAEEQDSLPIPKITSNAFRGNNSSAWSAARNIPTKWDLGSKKNVAWAVKVPRHGYNSPVISGRNVFLTGADAEARELYCFDVYTGELKWTVKADKIPGSPSTMPKVNGDTGLAASTVATNGQQVCAIFATGDVICADMEGKRLWAKNLGLPDNHYGFASSLLIYGNELIVQYENNSKAQILALSVKNGSQLWSKTPKDKIAWSSPILAKAGGKTALIVMGNPAITAYDPGNGNELWRVDCMSGEVGASPCSSNGIIYGASEYAKAIAINGENGEVLWEASDFLPEVSSPAANKDIVVVATSYGAVCAYNAQTGEMIKEHEVGSPFYSSPMMVEGKVYLFGNDGKAYVFGANSDFNLITSFQTGENTYATPAFTDGMMIVRSDKSLYCVKKM